MSFTDKLKRFFKKAELSINSDTDEKIFQDVLQAQQKTIKQKPAQPVNIWRIIMKSPISKLAAVAIIIVALLISFQFSNSGVAWGAVLEQVEKAQNIVFRITTNTKVKSEQQEIPLQTETITYQSSEYGKLTETYNNGELYFTDCWNRKEPSHILLFHKTKKFRKVTEDTVKIEVGENDDPCAWVKEIMKREYTKLGKNTINGKKVEGIECSDVEAAIFDSSFKKATARLWVEIGTNYPVRIEIDGIINMAQQFDIPENVDESLFNMEMSMVMDNFQWNVELDPNLFYPDIPSDYNSMDANRNSNSTEQYNQNSTNNNSNDTITFQTIE